MAKNGTSFKPGNRFWELVGRHGRKFEYEDPKEFEENIFDYFEKTASRNDWDKQEWVGKDGDEVTRNVAVPFTKGGLCIFLGITDTTFDSYKQRPGFLAICTQAERIIYTQKFEGAATGHFNANIIARDLGLVDKTEDLGRQKIKVTVKKNGGA